MSDFLTALRELREKALLGGGEKRIEQQHEFFVFVQQFVEQHKQQRGRWPANHCAVRSVQRHQGGRCRVSGGGFVNDYACHP